MEITAFNAEEAISRAVTILQCDKRQLKARVVRSSKSKFFGLIKNPGVYHIEHVHQEKTKNAIKRIPDTSSGSIEIINGVVKVTDPMEEVRYPSIITEDPNIDVFINDKKVHGAVIVVSKDEIIIAPKFIEPAIKINAEISENRMNAILTIKKATGKRYFCKDITCCNSAIITSDYDEIPAGNVRMEQCTEVLVGIGVQTKFINLDSIINLITHPDGGSEIVATGIFPIDGIDCKVRYMFELEEDFLQSNKTDDKIDFMDHTSIPCVEIGDVLAVKLLPAIPGRDGQTITGEITSASNGKDIIFKAGQGTTIMDNGNKVVATSSGRPIYTENSISVMPILTISENVDVHTGNIRFEGDVIVKGDVMEGLKITTKGNIKVFGSVFKASLVAEGNIQIAGRIIGSSVMAGSNIVNYLCIKPNLVQILDIVNDITPKLETLTSSYGYKYSKSLLQYIINGKKVIWKHVKEIESSISQLSDDEASTVMELLGRIQKVLIGINASGIVDLASIKILKNKIKEYIHEINNLQARYTNVILQYCQNSQVQSSGRIVITGDGTYLTNLTARDEIIYKKSSSVIRGGILVAGRKIKAGTVGSTAGIHTYCKVLDKAGKIDAVCFYIGTILNINDNITATKSENPHINVIAN